MPCHHTLEKRLDDYIAADPEGPAGIKTKIGNHTFRPERKAL